MNSKTSSTQPEEELLTLEQAVQLLGTSKPTFYRWLAQGNIKGFKVGRQWRFRKSDLLAYLQHGTPLVSVAEDEAEREVVHFRALLAERAVTDLPSLSAELEGAVPQKMVSLARQIIALALVEQATDIHIEPVQQWGTTFSWLRLRIDGVLRELRRMPFAIHEALLAVLKQAGAMNPAERRLPQTGRLPVSHHGKEYELRISTLPSLWGEAMVLRVLHRSDSLPSLSELGLTPEDEQHLRELLRQPMGLILAAGPVGSGRTTLLYACLQELAGEQHKVVSVEETVEHRLPFVLQVQVNPRTGFGYAQAMRAVQYHDPDVILVGDIPDLATLQTAIACATTGSLVLASVQGSDAIGAVQRLLAMGVEPASLAISLTAVVGTRVLRRLCAACKQQGTTAWRELQEVGFPVQPTEGEVTVYHASGCEQCRHTGFRGRTGLYELLVVEDTLYHAIARGASSLEMEEAAEGAGMSSFWQNGLRKVLEGVTHPMEVARVLWQ